MTDLAVILVAHGTRSAAGAKTTLDIVGAVAEALPHVDVSAAYVDVQEPYIADAVSSAAASHMNVIVVPLLFCGGYHVQQDVAKAIAPHHNVTSTGPLAPADRLTDLLVERLREAGVQPHDPVVMAVAGSSRPEANASARAQARLLADAWGAPVDVAFGAAGTPRVADAVAANRDRPNARVAVAALLIGEGHFADRLRASRADVITEPIGAHPLLIAEIVERITRLDYRDI